MILALRVIVWLFGFVTVAVGVFILATLPLDAFNTFAGTLDLVLGGVCIRLAMTT